MAVPATPYADNHFRSQVPINQVAATVIAVIAIAAAALILDPAIVDTPLFAAGSRLYFVICIVAGVGLLLFRLVWSAANERDLPSDAGYAFLVTAAPALFLVGRIRAFWILFFIILAIGIALLDSDSFRAQFSLPVPARWSGMVLLVWLVIAGITSFQLESRFAMPVAAAAAWSGAALLLTRDSTNRGGGLALLTAIAIVGAEMKLALSFLRIDPLLSATIWLMGIGITFAAIVLMRMRAMS